MAGLIQVFWYSTTQTPPAADPDIYSRTSPNGHLFTMATFFRLGGRKNPYIDSCLQPLCNGHLLRPTSTSVSKVAVVERFNCKLIAVLLNLFYVL